jgi:hypothetical protein
MEIYANDTMRFLLPVLYTKDYTNDFFFNDFFMGAYTSDINYPEMDNKLLLVYQFVPEAEYITFEECLFDIPTYAGKYDYEGLDVVVYAFDIPDQFKEDYIKVGQNQFTDLSSGLKLNISKMWRLQSSDELFQIITGAVEYTGETFDKQIFNIEDYDSDDLFEQINNAIAEEVAAEEGRDRTTTELLV